MMDNVYTGGENVVEVTSRTIFLRGCSACLQAFFSIYSGALLQIGGARLAMRLQRRAFAIIMEQDISYFDENSTGRLMTILTANVGQIRGVLVGQVAQFVQALFSAVVITAYMLLQSWRLTSILIGLTVAPIGVNFVVGWYSRKKTKLLMEQRGGQGAIAEEVFGEVRTVKSLAAEERSTPSRSTPPRRRRRTRRGGSSRSCAAPCAASRRRSHPAQPSSSSSWGPPRRWTATSTSRSSSPS